MKYWSSDTPRSVQPPDQPSTLLVMWVLLNIHRDRPASWSWGEYSKIVVPTCAGSR